MSNVQVITNCGYDGERYSEHSNKRGGASLAAQEGMSDEQIAKEGDWTNVKTAQKYIDEATPLRQKRVMKLQKAIEYENQYIRYMSHLVLK